MRRRNDNGSMIGLAFLIGGPIFLLMVHPLIFWLVFVPLVVIGIVSFINWVKK